MMNRLISPAKLALALLMMLPMACGSDGGGGGGTGTDGGGGGGNGDGGGGGMVDANPSAPRTVFRASKMVLLDPHAFALNGAFDATGTVNDTIQDSIDKDGDDPADNILDLNVSIIFQPLDQVGASTPMAISFADCSAPLETTACTQTAASTLITSTATNDASSTCLDALPDTTLPYDPPVVAVPAPCFSSNEVDVTVNLGTVTLPLKSATIAATYSGSPATSLVTGLLRGYVTTADADNVILPDDLPFVGGMPLSALLKEEDKDPDPSGTPDNNGWWFYISVEAQPVTYNVQ